MSETLKKFTIKLTAGTFRAAGEFEDAHSCPFAREIDKFFQHRKEVRMIYTYCKVNGDWYDASVPYRQEDYYYDAQVVANVEIPQNHVLRTITFTHNENNSYSW